VREAENRHLIHESGADSAIVSSGAAGRLLGLATHSPALVEVLEDLMTIGSGLDITQRDVRPEEAGRGLGDMNLAAPVVAVVRDGKTFRFDAPEVQTLRAGDKIVCLCTHEEEAA
jgi:voltage-gated potassium channel